MESCWSSFPEDETSDFLEFHEVNFKDMMLNNMFPEVEFPPSRANILKNEDDIPEVEFSSQEVIYWKRV